MVFGLSFSPRTCKANHVSFTNDTKSSRRLSGGKRYALPSSFCFWYSTLTFSSHASAARSAAFLAFAGVKSAGAVQVVYFLICLPRTSRSKQTVKRKEITLPFFLFSRMFAIETHPFISDVSMAFTRYFRSCALFCALLEFLHIFALHVLLSEVAKKALKSCDFKAFWWSEWRDSNSRPHGPEPCALPTALHPDM